MRSIVLLQPTEWTAYPFSDTVEDGSHGRRSDQLIALPYRAGIRLDDQFNCRPLGNARATIPSATVVMERFVPTKWGLIWHEKADGMWFPKEILEEADNIQVLSRKRHDEVQYMEPLTTISAGILGNKGVAWHEASEDVWNSIPKHPLYSPLVSLPSVVDEERNVWFPEKMKGMVLTINLYVAGDFSMMERVLAGIHRRFGTELSGFFSNLEVISHMVENWHENACAYYEVNGEKSKVQCHEWSLRQIAYHFG